MNDRWTEADGDRFAEWLRDGGIEGSRRVVRASESSILVSKFDEGFAARLLDTVDAIPEFLDEECVRAAYGLLPGSTARATAWHEAMRSILARAAQRNGLTADQQAEIIAGIDSVAALLDSVLWTSPKIGASYVPAAGEIDAYHDALARMDSPRGIFTRFYGEFEGARVENHCPGARFARAMFEQAWRICSAP